MADILTCPYTGKEYVSGPPSTERGKSVHEKFTKADHDPNSHGKRSENRIVLYYDERGVQKIRWATKKEAEKEWKSPQSAVDAASP